MANLMLDRKKKIFIVSILLYSTLPAVLVGFLAFAYAITDMDREIDARATEYFRLVSHKYETVIDFSLSDLSRAVGFVASLHTLEQLRAPGTLEAVFNTTGRKFDHIFEDMGVLGEDGRHIAYAGPYSQALLDKDYGQEPWFLEVMRTGQVISDVFLGYRRSPHFVIAVKRQSGGRSWVLRATVNAAHFSSILDNERFGRTGEVFIVNAEGVLQTRSMMYGNMLRSVDKEIVTAAEDTGDGLAGRSRQGVNMLFTVIRLAAKPDWFLVVQQEASEVHQMWTIKLKTFSVIFALGMIFILAAAVWAIRILQNRLERLDREKHLMDAQIIQSQKLAAIGQLSAGIAHEVNNPLAIIGEEAGWMQDLLKRESMSQMPEMAELQDSLREIVAQAGRCREITHKLLSFARKMESAIRDVDMNALVDDVVGMREREARLSNIEIVKDFSPDLPIIHSEPSLLRQVLLNLINNAIDAIPKGGTITVRTLPNEGGDGGVSFSVSDTGMGIPKENLEKIFDPFFTTKVPGKGTGLGLSICHGIIEKLGGGISVSSQPGAGTMFLVRLPAEAPPEAR